mmetsp:Transcript_11036/g.22415  ORF Transcript_11036/g.22415 Transcript_11036/m.22415 type:complete len:205 (-) Transcript_11036:113-727(-)
MDCRICAFILSASANIAAEFTEKREKRRKSAGGPSVRAARFSLCGKHSSDPVSTPSRLLYRRRNSVGGWGMPGTSPSSTQVMIGLAKPCTEIDSSVTLEGRNPSSLALLCRPWGSAMRREFSCLRVRASASMVERTASTQSERITTARSLLAARAFFASAMCPANSSSSSLPPPPGGLCDVSSSLTPSALFASASKASMVPASL